jgi:tetratricopeptide (TPR) repeat protein
MKGGVRALSLTVLVGMASPRVTRGDETTAPPPAATTSPTPAEPALTPKQLEAEAHYKRARELYQLGRYREAIAQLEAALKLDPKGAELLYNLGLIHEKLGDADEAIDAYQRYLAVLGPDADPEERNKIEAIVRRLKGAKAELLAREAKRTEHRFTPLTTGLLIGAGVSLVATTIFGVLSLRHDAAARDFVAGTDGPVGDRDALIDKSRREAVLADVFGALTLAATGAAITLYFTSEYPKHDDPSKTAPPPRSNLRLAPIAAGAAVRWELAF